MDLQDQLKNLFPDHEVPEEPKEEKSNVWLQDDPLHCKAVPILSDFQI